MRKYEEALAGLDTAIRLNPANAGAFHVRGQAHFRLGRFEAAVAGLP